MHGLIMPSGGLSARLLTLDTPISGDRHNPWTLSGMNYLRYDQGADNSVANTGYIFGFYNPWPQATVLGMEVEVTAQSTGGNVKYAWGVYPNNGGRPNWSNGPLLSTGTQTVANTATGIKNVAVSQALPRGLLWCMFRTDTAFQASWRCSGVKDRANFIGVLPIQLGRTIISDDFEQSLLTIALGAWVDATPLPTSDPGALTRTTPIVMPQMNFVY